MIDFLELPADGVKFEQFVRELLVRSGFEVHWTGVGPDGGRDLVVVEKADGALAPFMRKWLVSCKHFAHSGKSVGLDDVADIGGACDAVGADGFLLACSTQPSSSVIRRFEETESQGRKVIRYWDGVEIEKRLDTPETFPLIELFFPASARSNPWKIYNTYSPSFWAANYKDYFIYLASRIAHTFPALKDVEEIIRRLESVDLPSGSAWEKHIIRPRAVYFDNKHEQFSVFADYLYPDEHEGRIVTPETLDEIIQDGMGLYSDERGMWFLTHWDIAYVPCSQISDHFHLDHKQYYEPFMENYRVGFARKGFLSELY